jgi:MFS family permease
LASNIENRRAADSRRTEEGLLVAAPSVSGALAAMSLSMLLAALGTSVANVALPTLMQEFGAPFQAIQWIVLAYLLAVTTLVVGAGRLGDIVGPRRLLLAGVALFTVGSLLGGLAPTLAMLIAARGVQGIGAAVMMALTMAFVGETVGQARTGRAMGLLGTMSAIGTALGPSLGGVLLSGPGWRTLFLLNVPLGAVALLLSHRFLPADREEARADRPSFDVAGTALLAITLGAYALGMTIGRGHFGIANVALLGSAGIGAATFARVESRTASPLVRFDSLTDRPLVASLAANALVATVMMATLVVGPFYLARTLGLRSAMVGVAMSVGPLVAAAMGVPAGRLSDRFGARRVTIGGLGMMTVGAALLGALPTTLGVIAYVASIAVVTAGYALFQTANNTSVMSEVPNDRRGVVAGMLALSRNLGLVTGASVMGGLFALASGARGVATETPDSVAFGMRVTFAAAAVLSTVALLLTTGASARRVIGAVAVLVTLWGSSAQGQGATAGPNGRHAPTPSGPYPEAAAGWGPSAGQGRFVSRWAEDWRTLRGAGLAPAFKAVPFGGGASLTLSSEVRLRQDAFANAALARDNDPRPTLLRGALGADFRLDRHVRLFGEVATGQVRGRRDVATPNFQNDASLQQLFADVRGYAGTTMLGAMLGRQEFADGPRQLLSVSDGLNVHRTWNGVRLYAHGHRLRVGAFDLRVTRPARGAFDEGIERGERLRGVNASLIVSRDRTGANVYLDPFWIHSAHAEFRAGRSLGADERDSFGARLWGRRGRVAFDWTAVAQRGQFMQRDVEAWGVFAV